MEISYYLVDAFTQEAGKGNRAGVVMDAKDFTSAQMQEIARKINVSETAFIRAIEQEIISIRFFTPLVEVPICGHATIASFHTLVERQLISPGDYKLNCKRGMVDITVGDNGSIGMHVEKIEKLACINQYQDDLLKGLNLQAEDISSKEINIYTTGNPKVILEVKNEQILNNIKIQSQKLIELSKNINCSGFHVISKSTQENVLVNGRMFAPEIGITEDPVTGNSVGGIVQYLYDYRRFDATQLSSCTIMQGQAINKTGYIDVSCTFTDWGIKEISYYGKGVVAYQSQIRVT